MNDPDQTSAGSVKVDGNVAGDVVTGTKTTVYDQRGQQVGTQINVAGDYHQAVQPCIPLQRPPRSDHFTDRKEALAQLLAQLRPGQVVTLCGPGGIGKTALAAEAVWSLAPGDAPPAGFPDGILFHSFYGKPDPALALEHIALSFGEEPRPTPAEAALRALAGRRALLILDGAEEAENLGAVLDRRGGCGVLVTSRARQDALAERQDVTPLEPDDAVALLRRWAGEWAADDETAGAICRLVGRLPLALRLAGRYLAQSGETARAYLAWLEASPLEALDQGRRRLDSVPLLLERSLAQVSTEAREVLAVVGALALAPFGRAPLAAALRLAPNRLRRPLAELAGYGLLSGPTAPPVEGAGAEPTYQVSHALVYTYARERCLPPLEVLGRLAAYYDSLAREQVELGVAGYRCLDAARAHLLRVLVACAGREQWEAARSLVWAVEDYLDLCGYWTERVQALEVGIRAARALNHRRDEGAFLGNLGLAYADLGQVERAIAHYEQALVVNREIGDRRGEGSDLGNLGNAYRNLGQVERAIAHYEQALAISRAIGDRHNEGAWLGNLGIAYHNLGPVERAIAHYEQALTISREIGDRRGEGNHLGNLGLAYHNLGQVEQAIAHYEQALAISHEIGDRRGEGSHLGNLGLAYADMGHMERAKEYTQQALRIFEEIKSPYAEQARPFLGQIQRDIENVH